MSDVNSNRSDLPLVNERDRQMLLGFGQGSKLEKALDPGSNLLAMFEQHVTATPDAIACYAGTEIMCYNELNTRANRLARYLIKLGVGCDSVLGVYLERSIETLIALLGIFKAGAAYVPLDVNYPPQYLELMIREAGLSQIICHQATFTTLPPVEVPILNYTTLAEVLVAETSTNPSLVLHPDQLAYVLYTSGSTGTPKGVEVPHAQLTNCLINYNMQYPLSSDERVAQRTTTAFAVSVKELFAPLIAGAAAVILADDVSKDPLRLATAIQEFGITRLSIVPSHLEAVLEVVAGVSAMLSGLRYCITAGESLPKNVANRFKQLLPGARLLNNYGCTECNDITYQDVLALEGDYQIVSIGFPIANTEVYVLDADMQLVPVGVPGELCVAGQSMPKGYRGRPDLTSEKFVDHPFSGVPGARLFKTGDQVKRLPNGAIEYLGRQDFQIKVRGFRIDARQVEYVMGQYPGVATPIASHWVQSDQLIGYFTGKSGSTVDVLQLKQYLTQQLPAFMVPSVLVQLDSLPRLPNGKIDRRNMPSPGAMLHNGLIAVPETETEKALAFIWAKVLNLPAEKIGREDNFFELGGHSLGAARFLAALRQEFLFDVSFKEFFDSDNLKHLSESVDNRIALVLQVLTEMEGEEN